MKAAACAARHPSKGNGNTIWTVRGLLRKAARFGTQRELCGNGTVIVTTVLLSDELSAVSKTEEV
jgi:hypothetical protein